jgi:hypothetical protein
MPERNDMAFLSFPHRVRSDWGSAAAGRTLLTLVLVAGSWLALPARTAWAGSIFMKNGYIIQGPIVEHSEASVVLGWGNGKMTIYRRFVEKVDFEAGEEKLLAVVKAPTPAPEEEVLINEPQEELPPDLRSFASKVGLPPSLFEPHVGPSTDPTGAVPDGTVEGAGQDPVVQNPDTAKGSHGAPGSGTPGTGEPVGVASTVPPDKDLAPRVGDPKWGFSLRPPIGWRPAEVEGCVSFRGPAGADGFSPSVNVTSVKRGGLKWEEACQALAEDQKTPLHDYQPGLSASLEIAGRKAHRVSGRGAASGGPVGTERRVVVEQVLVEEGERLWLISTFTHQSAPHELAAVLESSVKSFQIGG